MPEILRMEDVDGYISELAARIKRGVYEARTKQGVIMELPEEISFDAVIVSQAQAIPMKRETSRTGSETSDTKGTERSTSTEEGKTTGASHEQSVSEGWEKSQSDEKTNTTGSQDGWNDSNGKESRESKEASTTSGESTGKSTQSADGSTEQTTEGKSTSEEKSAQRTEQAGSESSNDERVYTYGTTGT